VPDRPIRLEQLRRGDGNGWHLAFVVYNRLSQPHLARRRLLADGAAKLKGQRNIRATGVLYCSRRTYPSRTSGKSKEQVEWELQTFTERHGAIHEAFKRVAVGIKEVGRVQSMGYAASKLEHAFYDLSVGHANSATVSIPTIVSVCPDRFSFAEAARFVGYPFRTMTQGWNRQLGPLHVTCVYRTITDAQIRKHLGNPDIRVAKESWGFFARDPERSIQGLYLIKCSDETTLRIRLHDALEWLTATSLDEVVKTAQARGRILAASA